jgi:hypothetical protein
VSERIGDAPIETKLRETMNALARGIDEVLNGEAKGKDRGLGFVLLVFEFGEKEGRRCSYISNGADRKDIVTLFKEQIKRFEGQPEMTGRA